MRTNRFLVVLLATLVLAGCASRPINEQLTQFDPNTDYQALLREWGGSPIKAGGDAN